MTMRALAASALLAACKQSAPGQSDAEDGRPPLAGDCDPGERACDDAGRVVECDDAGRWTAPSECTGSTCEGGVCVAAPVCAPGARACEGQGVVECAADGSAWTVVETCPETCWQDACVTFCEQAELAGSFPGCVFYAYSLDNPEVEYGYEVVAANPGDGAATVTVEGRAGAPGAWTAVATFEVAPGGNGYTTLTPRNGADSMLVTGAAYRATATRPVQMYQLNGYPWLSTGGSSAGATLLLPRHGLGTDHYAVTLAQGQPGYYYSGLRANVVVVGAYDGTDVFVRASTTGDVIEGEGVPGGIAAGETAAFTLNEGDVLQLASAGADDDLTGTYVGASQPVAVLSGHEDGPPAPDATYPLDHYEEQLPSVDRWGTEFLAAKIVPTENPSAAPAWRVVAAEDDTLVAFEPGAGTTGLPADPVVLHDGEWFETRANGHFFLSTSSATGDPDDDKPVLVAQFVTADPDIVVVPPVRQWLRSYVFTNFAGGEVTGTITVARPAGVEVLLDGATWAALWSDAGGGFEVAQTGNPVGNHTIETADGYGLQVWIRGNGGGCTFSYVGGMDLAVVP